MRDDPIIVLGCFHSGTRALVSVLEKLGSYSGPIDNPWREHEEFVKIHEQLMSSRFGGDFWSLSKLLDGYSDDLRALDLARDLVSGVSIPNGLEHWHWKNPRSTFFLNTWQEIFPRSKFIHILRDGRDVALSLWRGNGQVKFHSLLDAFRLWESHASFLLRHLPPKTLTVKYEELVHEVDVIASMLQVHDRRLIERAKSGISPHVGEWRKVGFNPCSKVLQEALEMGRGK